MAEYIEREEIMNRLFTEYATDSKADVFELIRSIPASDVQPVNHAKWILFDRDSVGRAFYCSNCRKVTTTDDYEDTPLDRDEYFCMRCGADMREHEPIKG